MKGKRVWIMALVLTSLTLLASSLWLGSMPAVAQGTGTTTRVSVASDGTQANDQSGKCGSRSAISGDGRYVAFQSHADNLVSGDTNGYEDAFVHDRQTGQTTRVSVASDGTQADGASTSDSAISSDGRYVAFGSGASNLVSGDTNGYVDVFVHDRQTGQTTRVSVASDGTQGNGTSVWPAISGDGRYVAFWSEADNLVSGDSNLQGDIFVHDRQTGQTTRVSVASDGTQANGFSLLPAISGDGRYAAFASYADNLVSGDTAGFADVFVHDRQTGQTTRVSVASDGTPGNWASSESAISDDGRYVAFMSGASNLVGGDTNDLPDVFVHDRQTGQTTLVSVASDGTQGNGYPYNTAISGDGRYVALGSEASNLVGGDTNGCEDIFVHDRQTGQTSRVSVTSVGGQGNDISGLPAISDDGRHVVFWSVANNLVSGDTNGYADIFVHDRGSLWQQRQKLTASDGAADDHFGYSLAINGDIAVVGAYGVNSNQGAAYVFDRNQGGGNNWGQVVRLTASDGAANDRFGYSVAISGDTVVVGAYGDDSWKGATYIFERDQDGADNWGQVVRLTASDGAANDRFGRSVAISGDVIVVGAYLDDDQGDASGSVYVFARDQGGADNWGQVVKLTASDGAADDHFGVAVAISGDTVVVGADGDDSDQGAAYVFERDQGGADNWGQVAKLTTNDGATDDQFGYAVAINGDTVVVGARGDDYDQGAAYVFGRDLGGADNWGQVVKLTASDGAASDRFGWSVAISGDTVVVGARGDDLSKGAAYVFDRDQGGANNWGQVVKLIASDGATGDQFGRLVAISGDTAVVGADGDDSKKGSAYVYKQAVPGAPPAGLIYLPIVLRNH